MAERVIQGRTYRYDRTTGEESVRLALRALKLLTPAEDLVAAIIEEDGDAEDAGLVALVDAIDSDGLAAMMTGFVSRTRENGRLIEDTHGVMDRDEFCQVALFGMRAEFGPLFRDGVGATVMRARAAVRVQFTEGR